MQSALHTKPPSVLGGFGGGGARRAPSQPPPSTEPTDTDGDITTQKELAALQRRLTALEDALVEDGAAGLQPLPRRVADIAATARRAADTGAAVSKSTDCVLAALVQVEAALQRLQQDQAASVRVQHSAHAAAGEAHTAAAALTDRLHDVQASVTSAKKSIKDAAQATRAAERALSQRAATTAARTSAAHTSASQAKMQLAACNAQVDRVARDVHAHATTAAALTDALRAAEEMVQEARSTADASRAAAEALAARVDRAERLARDAASKRDATVQQVQGLDTRMHTIAQSLGAFKDEVAAAMRTVEGAQAAVQTSTAHHTDLQSRLAHLEQHTDAGAAAAAREASAAVMQQVQGVQAAHADTHARAQAVDASLHTLSSDFDAMVRHTRDVHASTRALLADLRAAGDAAAAAHVSGTLHETRLWMEGLWVPLRAQWQGGAGAGITGNPTTGAVDITVPGVYRVTVHACVASDGVNTAGGIVGVGVCVNGVCVSPTMTMRVPHEWPGASGAVAVTAVCRAGDTLRLMGRVVSVAGHADAFTLVGEESTCTVERIGVV